MLSTLTADVLAEPSHAPLRRFQRQESSSVGRLADGAGRNYLGALCSLLSGERSHAAQRSERVLNRDLAERAGFVQTGAQTWRSPHFVDDPDGTAWRNIGDRLPN